MLATVQCLIPLVAGVRRRLAEYERHLPVFDRRALDRSASLLRRLERGGQRRLAPTHSFLQRLAHGAPPAEPAAQTVFSAQVTSVWRNVEGERVITAIQVRLAGAALASGYLGSFQFCVYLGCFLARIARLRILRPNWLILQAC